MCARVTLDIGACVRKTLHSGLVGRVRRRPMHQSPEDTSQSAPIYFRFLSVSLRLHLSPRPMCVPLVPYVRGISMVSETDLSRLLPSFRDSLDTYSARFSIDHVARDDQLGIVVSRRLRFYLFFFFPRLLFTSASYERCELPIC